MRNEEIAMPSIKGERRAKTPTVVIVVGLLVGIAGLAMLFTGLGGSAPTRLQVAGLHLDIETSSLGLSVTIVGFTVAVVTLFIVMSIYAKQTKEHAEFMKHVVENKPNMSVEELAALHKATRPVLQADRTGHEVRPVHDWTDGSSV
jgi:hypothetical protein